MKRMRHFWGFGLVVFLVLMCVVAYVVSQHSTDLRWCSQCRSKRIVSCRSNLKQIGLALRMYAADNTGHFPSALEAVAGAGYLASLKAFTCHDTVTTPAGSVEEFDPERHCDFVYRGRNMTGTCGGHPAKKTIIAHSKPGNHPGHFHVLFADGSVPGCCRSGSIQEIAKRNGWYLPARAVAGDHHE